MMTHLLYVLCLTLLPPGAIAKESEELCRERDVLELLPDPALFKAEIIEDAELYTADNLYEYIDGAAEAFIAYDFEQLAHQVYLIERTEITVDIYDMGTLEDAFGIYSRERGGGNKFLAIGTEGYRAGDTLNFTQDRYYIKLAAFAETGDASSLLLDFSKSVSQQLPPAAGLPQTFSQLPRTDLVPHSETYIKQSPLGHKFLSPGYLADYRLSTGDVTVLLSPSADAQEVTGKLERLRDHFAKVGEILPLRKWGKDAFLARTKYQGNVVAVGQEHFAVVVVGVGEAHEDFVEGVLSGLEERKIR